MLFKLTTTNYFGCIVSVWSVSQQGFQPNTCVLDRAYVVCKDEILYN